MNLNHGRQPDQNDLCDNTRPSERGQTLLAQLGWSSVRQVFRITRTSVTRDDESGYRQTTVEVACGITGLSRE